MYLYSIRIDNCFDTVFDITPKRYLRVNSSFHLIDVHPFPILVADHEHGN